MPVTKKKGAIFPIYADTPPRAGPPASSSASSSTEKKVSRPALTSLEPSATRPRPSSSQAKPKASGSSSSLSSKPSRKLDIFADPEPTTSQPLSSKPLSSKPPSLAAKPTSSLSMGEKKSSSSSSRAPLASKRSRSPTDKENAPRPAPDSPASRTRSKSRLVAREQGGAIISFQDKLAAVAAAKAKANDNKAPTKPKARKFTVLADAPLSDVSEAYGATAEEPAGFRDAPPRSKPASSARTRAMTTRSIRS